MRAVSWRRRRSATRRRPSPGGIGMFNGQLANAAGHQFPAVAGLAVRPGEGHRRQGAVRLQRSVARHRAGGRVARQLLPDRLLQHASRAGRPLSPRPRVVERRPLGRSVVPPGIFRRQDVREVHRRGQGTPARRRADAGEPGHRHHDCDGGELLPAESRPVLRADCRQDSRQRAGARAARRRQAHGDRFHRRSEGRLRLHDPERPRQAGHQVERRHREPARDASDPVSKPASRCCRAST